MYDINIFAISISFLFLIVALIVIKKEELGIEKEVLIAGMLALIQLIILGFLIDTIFKLNIVFTFLMGVLMIMVASFVITKI